MSDPLHTVGVSANDLEPGGDRDAKIEQLLLVGLDHYFAARHDQAINVWTRVLFIDRGHARARAYIERARSALAERQRVSEELLQRGVDAFGRGEGDEARRLLQAAIESGAPAEDALAVLERLTRLEAASTPALAPRTEPSGRKAADAPARGRRTVRAAMLAAGLLLAAAAIGALAASPDHAEWRSWFPLAVDDAPAVDAPVVHDVQLQLPRRGEISLQRARSFASTGHLRDALLALDAIRPTDPQKVDADRLRADIQHQLLALTDAPAPRPADPEKGDRRLP